MFPADIEYLLSDPIAKMSHHAQSGLLYLLMRAWEAVDGTLENTPENLQECADMTAEEWCEHGPEILKHFEINEAGKLQNPKYHREWLRRKHRYESRKKG